LLSSRTREIRFLQCSKHQNSTNALIANRQNRAGPLQLHHPLLGRAAIVDTSSADRPPATAVPAGDEINRRRTSTRFLDKYPGHRHLDRPPCPRTRSPPPDPPQSAAQTAGANGTGKL